MSGPPLVLVDPPPRPFWPLTATRPVADLLAGTRTFRARWVRRFGPVAAVACDPAIAADPAGSGGERWPDPSAGLRAAVSTWVPPPDWTFGDEPAEHRSGDVPVAWRLDPRAATELAADPLGPPRDLALRLAGLGLPARPSGGTYCDSAWAVVAANPDLVRQDAADFAGADTVTGVDPFVLLGRPADLVVGEGVAVGPFVVLDAREGPIVLERDVRVAPHATLRGPVYAGPGTAILGGEVGRGSSIGPCCKVRGEVEQTIVQGFSNKAHDGFVGHSFLGEWVNLGADTVTSDLKNTYGPVRVEDAEGRTETGLIKVGAFLGDHVKTGIGTLLTTGARLGVGTHLFGGREVSPTWLPDFTWFDGRERSTVRWEPFERTLRAVMARREREPTDRELEILRRLHGRAGR